MRWLKNLRGRIRFNEPLMKHTTFKIGGNAKFFIEPHDPDDLKLVLRGAKIAKLSIFVLGSGSNLLVDDQGLDSVVIRLTHPFFKKIRLSKGLLEVGSGVLLQKLIKETSRFGLGGCEFLTGIPGTVGGAVVMNAGITDRTQNAKRRTQNKNIGDLVEKVKVMDYNGNIKTLNKKDLKFGYRKSNLLKYIVLAVKIRLRKKDKKKIREKIKHYLRYRLSTQELHYPSAGCIFENPAGLSAARLIDSCGLKGEHFGEARVSYKHANFIINRGKASAADVLKLMDYIKKKVKYKFNISLKPEIKIWQ